MKPHVCKRKLTPGYYCIRNLGHTGPCAMKRCWWRAAYDEVSAYLLACLLCVGVFCFVGTLSFLVMLQHKIAVEHIVGHRISWWDSYWSH